MAEQKDIIYVATNPAMPDWIKIGTTSNGEDGLRKRMKALSNTSVPFPFKLRYAVQNEKATTIESKIKEHLAEDRLNPKREFYNTSLEKAIEILQVVAISGGGKEFSFDEIKDISDAKVSQDELKERDDEEQNVNKRRANFRFADLGIEDGAELVFTQDETQKATVLIDKNKVIYHGKEYTLSGLTDQLLASQKRKVNGAPYWTKVNGTLYWTYDSETIDAIRRRKEEDDLTEE